MKKTTLLFFLLFPVLLLIGQSASLPIYEFDGGFEISDDPNSPFRMNPIKHFEIYEDHSQKKTIDAIHSHWLTLPRTQATNTPYKTNTVFWLKTRFLGSPIFNGSKMLLLTDVDGLDHFSFDRVDGYTLQKDGSFIHQQTGDQVPMKNRPWYFWANFIKLDIGVQDTVTLYLRLEGADGRFLLPQFKLYHIDETSVWPNQVYQALKHGLFYGMLLVQCFYFLLLYLTEREKIHWYFAIMVFGLLLLMGFLDDNFKHFIIFPSWSDYHLTISFIGIFITLFGVFKFTEAYFDYPKDRIIIKYIIPAFLISQCILSVFIIFNLELLKNGRLYLWTTQPIVIISAIIVLYIAFTSNPKKRIFRNFYLIAFSPLIFSLVFFVINDSLTGQTFTSKNLYDIIKLSMAAMLILLALSSGYRTNQLKVEKEVALQQNLINQRTINKAISKFVPNEFLKALDKKDITEVQLGDHAEKEVTVYFSDIRAYTTLSEQMSPTENFKFVQAFNSRMGPLIKANNGFINQYLGDGMMAIFPNNSSDALEAAIQMQQSLHTYNAQRIEANRQPIQIGIGMHRGSLMMGIIGDENRMDAATISDTVNTAARIESLTKHYKCNILLSESYINEIENRQLFNCRYLGQVQVMGKQQVIKIYECFDGDLPQQKTLKLTTLSLFNRAIQLYFNQSFEEAISVFENILAQNPKDKTAELFLNKAILMNSQPLSSDWTGIEMMHKK